MTGTALKQSVSADAKAAVGAAGAGVIVMGQPTREEILISVDTAEMRLTRLIGDWENIPAPLRLKLIQIRNPLLKQLIRANRRPVRRGRDLL